MKVMFFIPSLQAGGAERVIGVLANELVKHNIRVTITLISNSKCDYSLDKNVEVICLECDKDLRLSTIKRIVKRFQKIRDIVRVKNPNIVISFMANTNIDVCLSLLCKKIPIVVSERNDPKIDPPGKIRRILRKLIYRRAQGFVFQTEEAREFFGKKIQKKSVVILNPLTETISAPYYGEREHRIVAVGRLEQQKNYLLLLEAFKVFHEKYPDYVLEIYGDGSMRDTIEAMLEQQKLYNFVILKGFCRDVHEKIRTAAFFVMSSNYEGLPNALIEAMALGLPCVSTDCPCGGPRMLIENNINGKLVPVNDVSALLTTMCELVENTDMTDKIGKNAVKIKEKVDVQYIVDQWIEFLKGKM